MEVIIPKEGIEVLSPYKCAERFDPEVNERCDVGLIIDLLEVLVYPLAEHGRIIVGVIRRIVFPFQAGIKVQVLEQFSSVSHPEARPEGRQLQRGSTCQLLKGHITIKSEALHIEALVTYELQQVEGRAGLGAGSEAGKVGVIGIQEVIGCDIVLQFAVIGPELDLGDIFLTQCVIRPHFTPVGAEVFIYIRRFAVHVRSHQADVTQCFVEEAAEAAVNGIITRILSNRKKFPPRLKIPPLVARLVPVLTMQPEVAERCLSCIELAFDDLKSCPHPDEVGLVTPQWELHERYVVTHNTPAVPCADGITCIHQRDIEIVESTVVQRIGLTVLEAVSIFRVSEGMLHPENGIELIILRCIVYMYCISFTPVVLLAYEDAGFLVIAFNGDGSVKEGGRTGVGAAEAYGDKPLLGILRVLQVCHINDTAILPAVDLVEIIGNEEVIAFVLAVVIGRYIIGIVVR